MDLYPQSRSRTLARQLFADPGPEYRAAPFWSWNNRLDRGQLFRQLRQFKEMGFGGAHIHVRTGLETRYLGTEFLAIVRACTAQAAKLGLLTYLYDEDRWPSGYAGGLVTRDRRYRARHLLFTPRPCTEEEMIHPCGAWHPRGLRVGNGKLLARFAILLAGGALASSRRLAKNESAAPGETIWHLYLETAEPSDRFNGQTYVDTLNPAAIRRFIGVTHERYRRAVGKWFGREIPSIFTDEPQFARKQGLPRPGALADVILPFTDDFPRTYRSAFNCDFWETFPEIVWDLPDGRASLARYRYHEHLAERFAGAFSDTLGQWCRAHGIALTGHMMDESSLSSQSGSLSEVMRSYRAFDIPGIDVLCDMHEFNTAKQAQSAARQFGAPGVLSELYGVTGWHFDFVGHKAQGDWQAALGVTLRVPHLAWVSMKGDAKRDYPAPIGYQSPWYAEYKLVEDHFARINTAMTRGQPIVRVGVIHPVESCWLNLGPGETSAPRREEMETRFEQLTEWLLFGTIDFDFIAESLLPSQSEPEKCSRLRVGQMAYDAIIVPALQTVRSSTLDRLEAFASAGGHLIFLGEVPGLVDAVPSGRAAKLAAMASRVEFARLPVLAELEPVREVRVHPGYAPDWSRKPAFLHQIRRDGARRHLFLCNLDRRNVRPETRVSLRGDWSLKALDTLTGKTFPLAAAYESGWTWIEWEAPAHGSLLIELSPGRRTTGRELKEPRLAEVARLADPRAVTLSEPNVLLLDQAEWRINRKTWKPAEEVLRIRKHLCHHFKVTEPNGTPMQPWADRRKNPTLATVELRFRIRSCIPVPEPVLALEDAATTKICLNGIPVRSRPTGWYVDEAIQTVPLPPLEKGENSLVLSMPFSPKRMVEACYLLGDFGVEVSGRHAKITPPVRTLKWGDWTRQGLPFYAGNVTYHAGLPPANGQVSVCFPHFKAPTMRVSLDGKDCGPVAFSPFRVDLPGPGRRGLDITAFGNRANCFGPVHYPEDDIPWYGPTAYMSDGAQWAYEYHLRPMGILTAPIVLARNG